MSDTQTPTTASVHVLHPAPTHAPEPLPSLSGAPAAVHAELAAHPDGATTAELSLAAGLGRSTTGKALAVLEEAGLAERKRGGHSGTGRTPDRWHPAATTHESAVDAPAPHDESIDLEFVPAENSTHSTNSAALGALSVSKVDGDARECEPVSDDAHEGSAAQPGKEASAAEPLAPTTTGRAPVPPAEADGKRRLAPGGLRQMVIEHLQTHPEEAFTATRISRIIEKSSGAIANALVTLTKQHIAEQVSDRPRTYRLARPAAPTTNSDA
ncbi:MarR family transcriptional regulator [Streptomyces sp. NBC_01016]|uniref:MarR family transcriptional regulator n=1 Tax=Streptomyces sp. NBC_01016 TaxID=2903720 RepID=UPI00225B2AEB|nr:helix-turn-helix domain-containing protein [Streptomyces sp. NBC_01016]MCX4834413.1 MarR family transcriptional regulator [Streptomyces sp. NBC_01016]